MNATKTSEENTMTQPAKVLYTAKAHTTGGREGGASTTAMTSSTSVYTTRGFWERLWRMSGINFVAFVIIACVIYGYQPRVGASADALVAFYDGHRTRILIAAVFSGMAVLNLLWFAAALRTTLADAGQDGWGAAATASSTAVGGLFLLLITE